jgi:catechol 2,3-dioxygenase-like lactoylglutathione lyase family enzyme
MSAFSSSCGIRNLFHVCLQANNFERMLNYYTNILGFEQMFVLTVQDFRDILGIPAAVGHDARPWLTYLRIGYEQYLEMFAGAIAPPDFAQYAINRYPDAPLRSICLYTENIESAFRRFVKNDLDVLRDPGDLASRIDRDAPVFPVTPLGERYVFILDPECNHLQIVERPKSENRGGIRTITGIRSLELAVNNMDRSVDFYSRIGFAPDLINESASGVHRMTLRTGQFLEFRDLSMSDSFEMVRQHPNAPMGHFAFQVYSLERTAKDWANKGVAMYFNNDHPLKPLPLEPFDCTHGSDGCLIGWIFDPDGNKLEIMEQPGGTMQQKWEELHKLQ